MNRPTWKFWILFGVLAAGAHFVFGSGWSQDPRPQRSCGCLIELKGSEYCLTRGFIASDDE